MLALIDPIYMILVAGRRIQSLADAWKLSSDYPSPQLPTVGATVGAMVLSVTTITRLFWQCAETLSNVDMTVTQAPSSSKRR
ncbi:hypothetical protein N7523_004914 [Penicillium sp. IBT 18751x]|nr:hypothetical protein N7523_004914 [Penicillium sp. IBT 18751x]